jgi:excisionase family DNA binding protein
MAKLKSDLEVVKCVPESAPDNERLNARGAAEYLGVALSTVRRLSRAGTLPCHRITPRNIRYLRNELDAWIRSKSNEVQ